MMNSRYVTGLSALIAVAYFAFSVSVLGHFDHYLISPYFTIPVALSIFMVPTGSVPHNRSWILEAPPQTEERPYESERKLIDSIINKCREEKIKGSTDDFSEYAGLREMPLQL